mgnify:CR=1 FL=1
MVLSAAVTCLLTLMMAVGGRGEEAAAVLEANNATF